MLKSNADFVAKVRGSCGTVDYATLLEATDRLEAAEQELADAMGLVTTLRLSIINRDAKNEELETCRDAVLEEATRVCEALRVTMLDGTKSGCLAEACALRIRALKTGGR